MREEAMKDGRIFPRYDGRPSSVTQREAEVVQKVEDDRDPVLRSNKQPQFKRCGSKSRRSWLYPGYLLLALAAVIVLGYISSFYTTHQLGKEQQQGRQSQIGKRDSGAATQMTSETNGRANLDAKSSQALGFESSAGRGQQQQPGAGIPLESDGRNRGGMGEESEKEGARLRSSRRNGLEPGVSGTFANSEREGSVKEGEGSDSGSGVQRGTKPNVFFFLIDDMGHADIGYQSTDLREITPNLDALAAGGIKLSNYYSMSICTPARASLMTGRYPVRLGMQYSVIVPGQPWGLPLDEKTFPEYMNDAGYESHMVGKWHLGSYNYESLPTNRGFQSYLGYLNGEDNFWTHQNTEAYLDGKPFYDFGYGNETDYYDITRINKEGQPCLAETMIGGDFEHGHDYGGAFLRNPTDVCYTDGYPTDAFLGRAHQVVKSKTPWDEKPLFMYIAHQSVHSPLGPAPIEGFSKEERVKLETVEKATATTIRAKFAGVLLYLDKRIGSFVHMLEAAGWMENSIIVVASDNGGCPKTGGCNYPLRGSKQSMFEGGTKVPAFIYSKSHLPKESWGTTYDGLMHVSDWIPTLASATRAQVTGSAGALDGIDHWESIVTAHTKGSTTSSPRSELLYNWDAYLLSSTDVLTENFKLAQGAFRDGEWKLLMNVWCSGYYSHDPVMIAADPLLDASVSCPSTASCEDCADVCQTSDAYHFDDRLYNLAKDPREEINVIDDYPEIGQRLRKRALEVVFSEYASSGVLGVNKDSYNVWANHGWWMVPWIDKLSPAARRSKR